MPKKTLGFVSVSVNTFSLILIATYILLRPLPFRMFSWNRLEDRLWVFFRKAIPAFFTLLTRKAAPAPLIASSYVLCVIVVVKGMEKKLSCVRPTILIFFLFLLHQTNGISLS